MKPKFWKSMKWRKERKIEFDPVQGGMGTGTCSKWFSSKAMILVQWLIQCPTVHLLHYLTHSKHFSWKTFIRTAYITKKVKFIFIIALVKLKYKKVTRISGYLLYTRWWFVGGNQLRLAVIFVGFFLIFSYKPQNTLKPL